MRSGEADENPAIDGAAESGELVEIDVPDAESEPVEEQPLQENKALDKQMELIREAVDTNAVDIELDCELGDSTNVDNTTADTESSLKTDHEALQEPISSESEGATDAFESIDILEPIDAEPVLNTIPSVFFESSENDLDPLYREADVALHTEISAEIIECDDSNSVPYPPEGKDIDGLDKPYGQHKSRESQAVVDIAKASEREEPSDLDDPTIGFSQGSFPVDSMELDSDINNTKSIVVGPDSDSESNQYSPSVPGANDNSEYEDTVVSSRTDKAKGLFKKLIKKAVSWIKRFVGF